MDPRAAPWHADALTVNPYLGSDTLEPFVRVAQERGAGIYVLVKTSNPGSASCQDRMADGKTIYHHVADVVEQLSAKTIEDGYGIVGAVVGATYPQELAELRAAMPHVPLLVPGYGTQGGAAADVVAAFANDGLGAIVNNSRGINFAFKTKQFADEFGPLRLGSRRRSRDKTNDRRSGGAHPCGKTVPLKNQEKCRSRWAGMR